MHALPLVQPRFRRRKGTWRDMTAEQLLTELKRRGAVLSVAEDRLRWNAPLGVMTSELMDSLRRAKPALMKLLTGDDQSWDESEAWDLIQDAYRRLGELVPELGVLAWSDTHRPDLIVDMDRLETEW